jgi:hypothetical protein
MTLRSDERKILSLFLSDWTMIGFLAPSPWVPLSSLDWTFAIPTSPPPGCSGLT